MIRKLMASCAVAALISAGAMTAQAQTDPAAPVIVEEKPAAAQDNATSAAPTTDQAASEEVLTPEQPTLASVFIGRSVFSSADPESDNIGDVNDLIVSDEGTITHAVVGVGGFLGMGEKDVAVPFDKLEVVERDGDIRLIYAATREELEAAPALDRTAYDPMARFQEQQSAAADSAAPDASAPAPTGDLTAAPSDQAAVEAEAPAPSEDPAAAPITADATNAPPLETPPAEPSADMAAAPDATAPTDAMTAPAEQDVAATTETEPASTPPATSGEVSFLTAGADQVQASDLMGKSVLNSEQERIGEISDLILEEEGKSRVALIDVGGFLGVGEKTVGIPFDQLQISKAEDGVEQVTIAMSKAELEQLPAIVIDTAAAGDAATQDLPAADQTAATPPAEPATTDQPADMAQAPATDAITTGSINRADYAPATQEIAASELIGAVVYGPEDANLGEVSDLIFNKAGDIEAAVIDVGGFLGMGEKPVALHFEALDTRVDENGAVSVVVNATQEQLNQAPVFEEPGQASVQ